MKRTRWSAALAVALVGGSLVLGSPGATANPHDRILFTRNAALVTADQDGSDVRQVSPNDTDHRANADWSPDGRYVVYTKYVFYGSGPYDPQAWVLDVAKGTERQITDFERTPFAFDWSPDGKHIAYTAPLDSSTYVGNENLTVGVNDFGVWVMDADGGNPRVVTRGSQPRWSPDGSRLVSVCGVQFTTTLCLVNADGTAAREIPGTKGMHSPDWAPDGVSLVAAVSPSLGYETVVLSVDGVVERRFPGWTAARWSPDGDLAFVRYPAVETMGVCLPDPCDTYRGIFMAERDGSGLRRVTTNQYDLSPQFAR